MRTNDSQLVVQAVMGDDKSFTELMNRYKDAVYAIVYSYLGDFEDAQDAAQETFIRAYSQLKYLREPAKFGPWLRRIATNCAGVMYRCRRSTVSIEEETIALSFGDEAEQVAVRAMISDALNKLSEKARVTTMLFYINGYTHSEIADLLEVPVNTVHSRLKNARRKLSEEMMSMVKDVLNEEKRKVTLNIGKHTIKAEPIEKTEDEELDTFLFSLTSILEISFGDYIRSIYLNKTYMPFTEKRLLPLCIVIKDDYDEAYRWKVWSVVDHVKALSSFDYTPDPLYLGRENPFYNPNDFGSPDLWPCSPLIKLLTKADSLLLWGEDIRDRIALPDKQVILKDVLMPPLNYIKQKHYAKPDGSSALDETIVYPLTDPDPENEDRGCAEELTGLVAHIARALVYMTNGKFVYEQHRLSDEYSEHVGGLWTQFVRDVLVTNPRISDENQREQARLRAYRQMTTFENYFLEQVAVQDVDVSDHLRMGK